MRRTLPILLLGVCAAFGGTRTWAATPVGSSGAAVQPGGEVVFPEYTCVLNFLFAGSDGQRYFGSAGDCVLPVPEGLPNDEPTGADRERTWPPGTGPVARSRSSDARIGEVAYAIDNERGSFALVRLDAGVAADPRMAHFGGPTGHNDERGSGPAPIHCVGTANTGVDAVPADVPVPNARSGFVAGLSHPDRGFAFFPVVLGDAGGPCITADGGAVGLIVGTGLHVEPAGDDAATPIEAGNASIQRLGPLLSRASEQTGVRFELLTAPLR